VNKKIKEIKRITIGSSHSFLNDQDEEVMQKIFNDDEMIQKLHTDEMLLSQSSFKGSFASNSKQGQGQVKQTSNLKSISEVKATSILTKKPLGLSQTKNYV
jgi:hypothetical protein